MTDKELLELAAKAAGIEVDWDIPPNSRNPWRITGKGEERGPASEWNPLTDDGDALRLAVKLDLEIYPNDLGGSVATDGADVCGVCRHNDDKYAATRHAIVRAAAEIGKGK